MKIKTENEKQRIDMNFGQTQKPGTGSEIDTRSAPPKKKTAKTRIGKKMAKN
jgi:hypothetical protein